MLVRTRIDDDDRNVAVVPSKGVVPTSVGAKVARDVTVRVVIVPSWEIGDAAELVEESIGVVSELVTSGSLFDVVVTGQPWERVMVFTIVTFLVEVIVARPNQSTQGRR